MLGGRAAGVLLHPTSLPGPYGIGDFGPEAHAYIDWLAQAGISWWQVLPLTVSGEGHSPYCGRSSFAANPLLINPDGLVADGLLTAEEVADHPLFPTDKVDFPAVIPFKERLWRQAWTQFKKTPPQAVADAFTDYRTRERRWLDDYALFSALKDAHDGTPWHAWPKPLAFREPRALSDWRQHHADEVTFHAFVQFLAARQWQQLRQHAQNRRVKILGDLPMFVSLDSAEVWSRRDLFLLDQDGQPTCQAGVPPDYFNEKGQLWGNPIYDWTAISQDGFRWWIDRVKVTLEWVDAIRLDHFRGFCAYWEVPAGEETAINGAWVPGPGKALFDALEEALGRLPFLAEDLGDIDEDVWGLRDALDLPGMAVLQFAFNPHMRSLFVPYNHHRHLAVYPGTHDNNTARGWYTEDASEDDRDFLRRYLSVSGQEIHWDLIRAASASVANLAVFPHQDLGGLGSTARMNTPGVSKGNWRWRLERQLMEPWIKSRLADLVWLYGRWPEPEKEPV